MEKQVKITTNFPLRTGEYAGLTEAVFGSRTAGGIGESLEDQQKSAVERAESEVLEAAGILLAAERDVRWKPSAFEGKHEGEEKAPDAGGAAYDEGKPGR